MNPKKYRSILTLHWNDKVGTKKYIQKVDEIDLPESVDLKEIERKYGIKSNNTPSRHVKLYKKDVEFFKEHVSIDWDFKKYDYFINYRLIDTSPRVLKESYFVLEWCHKQAEDSTFVSESRHKGVEDSTLGGSVKIPKFTEEDARKIFELDDDHVFEGGYVVEPRHSIELKKFLEYAFDFENYFYYVDEVGVYE
jgi:hypothetical protein